MLGRTPFDVMPPEEKERMMPTFWALVQAGGSLQGMTSTAYNSRGELIYIETSGVPFFDTQRRLLGYRGITRDITERRQAERQIEVSNQKQKEILDSIQDDFYVLDREGRFV